MRLLGEAVEGVHELFECDLAHELDEPRACMVANIARCVTRHSDHHLDIHNLPEECALP